MQLGRGGILRRSYLVLWRRIALFHHIYLIISYYAIFIISYRMVSCYGILSSCISYDIISYHLILYYVMLYYAVLFRVLSSYIVSYRIYAAYMHIAYSFIFLTIKKLIFTVAAYCV